MNILILGEKGFLAKNYVFLYKRKYNLFYSKYFKKEKKIREIQNNSKKIISYVKKKNISHIINFIGYTSVDGSEIYKKKSYKSNFEIVKVITQISNEAKCKLIHISSDQVFSLKKGKKAKETDKKKILNFYSYTKKISEDFIIKKSENYLIIRTNFFGWSPRNRNTFVDKIFNKSNNNQKIELWYDVFFTPVYCGVLCLIISKLLKIKNKKQIFHVSSNQILSKYMFGKKILKLFNKNSKKIIKINYKKNCNVPRPKNMSLDNNKILKIFPSLKKKLDIAYMLKKMKIDQNRYTNGTFKLVN